MQEGLRSSDKEVSEGVSVMAPSAAVTKFLTDWAGAASDEACVLLEDESYGSPDNSVVVEVLKKRSERQTQLVQMLMAQVQASTTDAAAARTQAGEAFAVQAAHPANSLSLHLLPSLRTRIRIWRLESGCLPLRSTTRAAHLRIIFIWQALICLASLGLSTRASTILSKLLVLLWLNHVLSLETLCSWAMV
jgi:hypothetical protein